MTVWPVLFIIAGLLIATLGWRRDHALNAGHVTDEAQVMGSILVFVTFLVSVAPGMALGPLAAALSLLGVLTSFVLMFANIALYGVLIGREHKHD